MRKKKWKKEAGRSAPGTCDAMRQRVVDPVTVTVTSVGDFSMPSVPVARRRYVPGSLNVAETTTLPSLGATYPGGSKATSAGPRYTDHPIDNPLGGRGAAGSGTFTGDGSPRGFSVGGVSWPMACRLTAALGIPSSERVAASVSGWPTATGRTAATVTVGG